VQSVGNGAGEAGHGEHGEQRQQPIDEIVGVEAGRIEREPDPGPPDREEEEEEAPEAGRSRIGAQRRGDLGDRGDENEVEKQLQPGRPAVHLKVERAKPRRIEKTSKPAQGPPALLSSRTASSAHAHLSPCVFLAIRPFQRLRRSVTSAGRR
jgi:hypothetical protein